MGYSLERCEKCGKLHVRVYGDSDGPKTFHKELPEIVPECED